MSDARKQLPAGLITGKTARLPGDYKAQPKATKTQRKRHTPGKMNKREQVYANYLEALRLAGKILAWQFEAVTLKLADAPPGMKMKGVRITPDFLVWVEGMPLELHEIKGHREDDWVVKWKLAIERYPMFRFVLVEDL